MGCFSYTIEAWTDHYATWRRNLIKKVEAGDEVDLEIEEGARLIEAASKAIGTTKERKAMIEAVDTMRTRPKERDGHVPRPPRRRGARRMPSG